MATADFLLRVGDPESARVVGRFVTFITHPSFSGQWEDAYELFSEVEGGGADNHFWVSGTFMFAAIGDGGDTALTYDIATFPGCPNDLK
jgi:hypothetical protein